LLGLVPAVMAAPGGLLQITAVQVDTTHNVMTIMGQQLNFGPGPLVVTLGQSDITTKCETPAPSATTITCTFSGGLPAAGDYLLTVGNGNGQSQSDAYALTIGKAPDLSSANYTRVCTGPFTQLSYAVVPQALDKLVVPNNPTTETTIAVCLCDTGDRIVAGGVRGTETILISSNAYIPEQWPDAALQSGTQSTQGWMGGVGQQPADSGN